MLALRIEAIRHISTTPDPGQNRLHETSIRGPVTTSGKETGIDVVIGAHSHTELHEAIIVNDRTPVVQTGKYGENLGELVITLDGNKLTVDSYRLFPIDDTIAGDRTIADEIDKFKRTVTEVVFASRGYSIDQPLVIVPRDIPNTYTDIAAGTILANFCTDAFRSATKADLGFTANAMTRRPYSREVRCTNRLRRVRGRTARCGCSRHNGRQPPRDRLLYWSGIEASFGVFSRG
jgi:2',3'-cyclic-nucleotide 2'-phosphodiesterase (5'-nucleotidase family)